MPRCASEAAGTGVLAGQEGFSWVQCQLWPRSSRTSHPLPWLCAALDPRASQHHFMLAGLRTWTVAPAATSPFGSFPSAFFAKCYLQRGPEYVPAAVVTLVSLLLWVIQAEANGSLRTALSRQDRMGDSQGSGGIPERPTELPSPQLLQRP